MSANSPADVRAHYQVPDSILCWWAGFRSGGSAPEGWVTDEMGTPFHEATMEWLRSLGVDPTRVLPTMGVCPWRGKYELHVDEVVQVEPGVDRCDPLDQYTLLTQRRIVHVEAGSWPARPAEVSA